jgi:hypothetical protein
MVGVIMKLATLAPVLMASILGVAAVGCASNTQEDAASDEGAFSSSSALEVSGAVGALVVDGKKLCTAALVDIDAGARIGNVSAHARQIVFGGACVGQLSPGNFGAAVFVSQQNGVSISTPIIAFDFKSQASAGLAVGILGAPIQGATPIDAIGTGALVNAGVSTAQVFQADENGVVIGANVNIHAGVAFSLDTTCADFSFAAQASVSAGAGIALRDDGLGTAAFVKIGGKIHFAAHIDAACVIDHFGQDVAHLGGDVLATANNMMNALNSFGTGKVVAIVHPNSSKQMTMKLKMTEHVAAIRMNGQGYIHAYSGDNGSNGACVKMPLIVVGGPCEVRPPDDSGYAKGEVVEIIIDTKLNPIVPDELVISTTQEPKTGG